MNGKRYVTVTVHQAWFFAQGRVQKITVARGIDKKEKWFQSTPDELAPLPTNAANPYRPTLSPLATSALRALAARLRASLVLQLN